MVTSPDYQVNNHMQDASNLPLAPQAWSLWSPSRPPERAVEDIPPPRSECVLIQMMKANLLCAPQGVIGEKWGERSGIKPRGGAGSTGEGKSDHFRACQPPGTSPGVVF